MFERNLFLNHFNSRKPQRSYDREVIDYQGFRWGYYSYENIYEKLNTGEILPAPLFEDMNNSQSESAASSSASSSDDGGFGHSIRSKNVSFEIDKLLKGRYRGKGGFKRIIGKYELTPDIFNTLRLRNVSFTKRYPLKTDAVVRLNYQIKGGVPPYTEQVTWYVNGGVTSSFVGQPKTLGLYDKNHNDFFTAKITVTDSDSPAARVSELVGVTGVIMQPISWSGFTISPQNVGLTQSVTLTFQGLTGSPRYFDFNGTPIASPVGVDKSHYLYIGRSKEEGQTRAGPQPSSSFSLDLLQSIGYNLQQGTALSGAAILSNNAQTITAPVENTSTIAVSEENSNLEPVVINDPFNDTDKVITDAGFALGKSVSYLNLSGTGDSSHPTLEYYDHGSSRWRVLNVVWSGTSWTATDVPFRAAPIINWNTNIWWSVKVRYVAEPLNMDTTTNRFRPGVVISSLSQSERENIWLRESLAGAGTVVNEKQCQLLCYTLAEGNQSVDWTDDSASGWKQYQERQFVTNETYTTTAGSCVSTPIVAMSNLFARLVPNYPIMLVDNQWAGTSRRNLGEDDDDGRTWKALEKQILWLSERNSYIGIQDEMWWNSDAGFGANWSEYFCPLYTKQYSDGTEYIIGSTLDSDKIGQDAENGFDHCFFDLNVSPDEFGEGVFRRDRTTLSVMGTNTFNDWDASGSQGNDVIEGNYNDAIRRSAEVAFQTAGATTGVLGSSPRSVNIRRLRQSLGHIFDDTTEYHPMRKVFSSWSHDATLCLYGDFNSTDRIYDDSTHPAKGGSIADAPYQFVVNGLHGWVLTAKYCPVRCEVSQKQFRHCADRTTRASTYNL
jgi:hypothetical protein